MLCPSCKTEMLIDHAAYTVTGDSSPGTPTRIYNVPYFRCRNPQCGEYEKLTEGEKIPLN